ncbi:sialidase-2-like [Lynx pardinus]|uniref:Sialidase-2-like n=1 Tax=Lynx pardinus TaxID=191816 RepID=A0A485NS30_LYNPA|nr:sialidase-2-like [Lynx pardinus]
MESCPILQKERVFQSGAHAYRIPALLYLPEQKTVLAFAEQRISKKDEHAELIVLRRGSYDASTHQVQVRQGEATSAGNPGAMTCLDGRRLGNRGTRHAESQEGPRDPSEMGQRRCPQRQTELVTPVPQESGISVRRHNRHRALGTAALIDCDVWQMGGDCHILPRHGQTAGATLRLYFSRMGNWTGLVSGRDRDEPGNGCARILFSCCGLALCGCSVTWLLYTHPTDPRQRAHLGAYLSKPRPGPAAWSEPALLATGSCAYSDLQSMGTGPDGSPQFGCLYESDDYEAVMFLTFTLKQAFPAEFLSLGASRVPSRKDSRRPGAPFPPEHPE